MDFSLPRDDDQRRLAVRRWLADHPDHTPRDLAEAGYVVPHWPKPWGLDADAEHQLIIQQELRRGRARMPMNGIGIGWAGPTILSAGTPEQVQRFIPRILSGEDLWAQCFSEPDAGSDLASIRTTAVRDGDVYVVSGQKIWSTFANVGRYAILLARTDPDAEAHQGISYFVLDLSLPGIEVRPIVEMTGGRHFNEVFLTDVRIPVGDRIGAENDGWRLTRVTLGNERVSLSEGGICWGDGPLSTDLFTMLRRDGGLADPVLRQRAARLYEKTKVLELLGYQILSARLRGSDPGPKASVKKAMSDKHGQDVANFVKDYQGTRGMLGEQVPAAHDADPWHWSFLFSPALTVGGGTAEVQRNIIGERLLGLPREPNPDKTLV